MCVWMCVLCSGSLLYMWDISNSTALLNQKRVRFRGFFAFHGPSALVVVLFVSMPYEESWLSRTVVTYAPYVREMRNGRDYKSWLGCSSQGLFVKFQG